ncbi:hypothetical protein LOTGIDRAFT_153790 [Lottia gigantea]|uniref:Macro domain-containing protein n=1 Tax=Lottia gigantea TaxID=225164 RepID=V3ZJB8_LOTGI|nr:hypothetical protein LOTGIDRAFT_153790 [Lottia gigantea]ESO91353.1 hypothetical protein LOTGIDRAFT_153790 [Lottia gigantea]
MGNNQSSEHPDVYTYHETVLKQGAQSAASDSSDESDDEMQEGYSRETPTSSNVEDETNSNSGGEENSDSEEKNPEQISLDQSELERAGLEEISEAENEAEASSSSIAFKQVFQQENSEFATPPSSPLSKEPSPGPSRRSTRLQLKASTINIISKKRPRLSMRDSDDSDDDLQYSTPSATRKTPSRLGNISAISDSSKSQVENISEVRAVEKKHSNEANITPKTPSSSHQLEASTVRTPSYDKGRPNLRSSGGESRPFLRAKRSAQLFGKNAVHLQKVVSPPTNEQYTERAGEVNVDVIKIVNDESNSCINPRANNQESENVTLTNSATVTESEKTPQQPAIVCSEGSTSTCTTFSNSVTNDTISEINTVVSTQNSLLSETQQDQLPANTYTTVGNQIFTEARSEGNDVTMTDVTNEKECNTSRTNMGSEKFSASGSHIVQPMDAQSVENFANDITIPKTLEVINVEQVSQNRLPVFGSRNIMTSTSTEDLQPSEVNTTGGLLSFSQLANSQTAAPSISSVTATSSALMVYPHSQAPASTSSQSLTCEQTPQIHTSAPSTSIVAAPSAALVIFPQISRSSQNGFTPQIHTPISPQVINQTPKVANPFPFSPPSTLSSVQKCCIFPISSNFDMTIRQGDIIKQDATAIVNSTDIHLRHQGAVSRLIAEAASPQMMIECQQHLMNHGGSLDILHVMDTIAGGRLNTNVERIIHVIPPSGSSTHFDHLSVNKLVSAYLQCMLHSDRLLNSTSLAFPLLGAGSFPTDISINAFYNAVLIYLSDKRSLSRLNDIRLIINEPQIFQFAVTYFTSCYENILTQGIDSAVAEALDGFYGNRNSNLSSFCVRDEVDGRSNKKWSATESLTNLFRGPPVKRPRL